MTVTILYWLDLGGCDKHFLSPFSVCLFTPEVQMKDLNIIICPRHVPAPRKDEEECFRLLLSLRREQQLKHLRSGSLLRFCFFAVLRDGLFYIQIRDRKRQSFKARSKFYTTHRNCERFLAEKQYFLKIRFFVENFWVHFPLMSNINFWNQ
jgi:hypothetical protein